MVRVCSCRTAVLENHYRQVAELPEKQTIGGWEWAPRKFGNAYVDRRRLFPHSKTGEDGLFGREYVTVSSGGCEQRWIVVNEVGDAMPVGAALFGRRPK